GDRHAPQAPGGGRGAGDEGADQDALPDSRLHLPRDVHRRARPCHAEPQDAVRVLTWRTSRNTTWSPSAGSARACAPSSTHGLPAETAHPARRRKRSPRRPPRRLRPTRATRGSAPSSKRRSRESASYGSRSRTSSRYRGVSSASSKRSRGGSPRSRRTRRVSKPARETFEHTSRSSTSG